MKTLILLIALFALPGCASMFADGEKQGAVGSLLGLNYNTELEYRHAVNERIDRRELDPALAAIVKERLYALWTQDRKSVLDSYELDDAVKTVIVNKLAD